MKLNGGNGGIIGGERVAYRLRRRREGEGSVNLPENGNDRGAVPVQL